MKRYCVVCEIAPEHVEEYCDIHLNAWPELLEAFKDTGMIDDMIIYNYKNLSIILYTCEDIDQFYEKLNEYPVVQKWNVAVHPWFEESTNLDGGGAVETVRKIFDYRQQLEGRFNEF